MSFNSLHTQISDIALMNRVNSCGHQQARENPELAASDYGKAVANGFASPVTQLGWPVCLSTEAEYASALLNDIPNPGGDESVITDLMILSAVQTNWPPVWPLPVPEVPAGP